MADLDDELKYDIRNSLREIVHGVGRIVDLLEKAFLRAEQNPHEISDAAQGKADAFSLGYRAALSQIMAEISTGPRPGGPQSFYDLGELIKKKALME
jgi:hypothetical protein